MPFVRCLAQMSSTMLYISTLEIDGNKSRVYHCMSQIKSLEGGTDGVNLIIAFRSGSRGFSFNATSKEDLIKAAIFSSSSSVH